MLIKIAIIGIILVAGGMLFSSEISGLFPNSSYFIPNSLKNDVSNIGSTTTDSIKDQIDSLNGVEKQIDESFNKVTQSSKEFITSTVSEVNPIEQVGNIKNKISSGFASGGSLTTQTPDNHDDVTKQSEDHISQESSTNDQSLVYETLSLSTIQQPDENILLQYQDTSGKTESVSVILRNSEKEIFSGKFFSSMFETTVSDTSNMPYQIDLIVVHQEYGTITSSVFNPGDSSNSKISGIFSKS